MISKYKIQELTGCWAVLMTANQRIVGTFKTQEAALSALSEFENGERTVEVIQDVWVIGDDFVIEPYLGGMMLGEIIQVDMNQYNVIKRISQEKLDELMETFFEEEGYYPDT